MPRTFDRRTPVADKNPLAKLLDFENWASAIDETAEKAGKQIRDPLQKVEKRVNTHSQWFQDAGVDEDNYNFTQWAQALMRNTVAPLAALLNPLLRREDEKGNLLANGIFRDAISISGGPGWVWDATVGRGGVGSAQASPAGGVLALRSNPVAVTEGQKLDVSVWVNWLGLASAGQVITLGLVTFLGDVQQSGVVVDSVWSPAANQFTWLELSGTWVVPAGVDSVQVRLAVENATAGQVWFDDAVLVRRSLLGLNLQETWNKIVGGHTNQVVTDATLGDVEHVMFDINRDITNTQSATITLANIVNAPKNVPEWVSPNPFEDVSYPRALLTKIVDVTDTANGLSGVHTHSVSGGTYTVPVVAAANGAAYFNTVTCTYDRIYNTAVFTTDGGSTLPPSVYLSIWKTDPVTGAATLEYNFGNVRPLMATGVAGDLVEQRFTTSLNLYPLAGEKRRVVIVPVGGPLSLGAIRRTTVSNTGFYPQFSSGLLTGQTGTPASPVADNALTSSNFRVWTSLGQALEPDLTVVSLIENFAISDTKDWQSSSWQQFQTSDDRPRFRVTSGQLYLQDGATLLGTIIGNWTMQRIALHRTRLHTPNQAVELTLGTDWDINAYDFAYVAAVLRATAGATAGVTMQLDSPDNTHVRLRICTHTSNVGGASTVRATAAGIAYRIGDRYRIEVINEGAVGSPLYVYRCYRNDAAIPGAVWADTTNVIPDADAYRSVGFTVGARDNGIIVFTPAHLASWVATDLSDSTP